MKPRIQIFLALFAISSFFVPFSVSAQKAPSFSLHGANNKIIKLSNYRGKVVYVDFWASWCAPCRQSFPWMNKMQTLYGKNKFSIIAINLDKSPSTAKQFLKKIPASFKVAFDPSGKVAEAYRLKAMPSSFLINEHGQLVYTSVGFHGGSKEELENQIRRQLGRSMLASNQESD